MGRVSDRTVQPVVRAWFALAVTAVAGLIAALALVGPTPWVASELVLLSLAGLALAGTSLGAAVSRIGSPRPLTASPVRSLDDAPLLRGRATDPVRHPLAPRAPGLA